MKQIFFFATVCLLMVKVGAQKCRMSSMPTAVMEAFNKAYPNAQKIYCGKDSAEYQVSFFNGKAPVSVTYNINGSRLLTEMQIPAEDLPNSIMDFVQKNYPDQIFQEVAQITNTKGIVTFEVQINEMDLIFDAKGNFLQSLKFDE